MDEIWADKVREYRESIKEDKPELDYALLFRILDLVNESSEVRVAVEPIADDGSWSSEAPSYAVSGVRRLDDGKVALTVNSEKHGIEAGALYTKLKHELKRESGKGAKVLYVRHETVTELTDAYSHALVREQWAGMPFDLVLAVRAS